MTSALSVKSVVKEYHTKMGSSTALNGISFEIEKGEFFGYLGPNGAGKTTTIKLATGLATPTSGSIRVFGHDVVNEYQQARMKIGLAAQDFNFDIFSTVYETLKYQGGYYGMKGHALENRIEDLLKEFNLKEKRDERVMRLSGGMKRRLQLCKALIHNPELLIMDEPTAGVDVELRRALWRYLERINKNGTSILLTTHYIEEAEKLCDRIGIVYKGKIVEMDDTEKLIQKMSKQKVVLKLSENNVKLPKTIAKNAFEYNESERVITIACEDVQAQLPAILEDLTKHKIKIENVEILKSNLEDIYVNLTGGDHGSLDRI
ncbi:MAG: ABC transporter ATP-binding protein [archaeon]